VVQTPRRHPRFGEDDFEAPPDGVGTPRSRDDDFEAAPDEGVGTPDFVRTIYGGKLRCTGATWSDAVVIFPGEVLAFQNIERQAHALRTLAPGTVAHPPPAAPDPGEDDFEGEE